MDISREERELYDRQIRLWGLEGQSRLRNARILVLGFQAVAVEVVKNLCLAGVGSLVLQGSETIDEDHLSFNFFVRTEDIGKSSVDASVAGIQRLNPRVSVTTEHRKVEDLDSNFISSHDVVVVTQLENRAQLGRIDRACRSSQCSFFYSLLNGFGGFLFVDLGEKPHEFVVEREIPDNATSFSEEGKVSRTQTIVAVKPPDRAAGSSSEVLTVRESFESFDNAFAVSEPFGKSMKIRNRNKVSPFLPAFLAQIENAEDLTENSLKKSAAKLGLPDNIITAEFAEQFRKGRGVQISSLASVLGGVLSQEVINYLTMRHYPIQNTLIYDALTGKGPIYFLSKDL